MAAFLEKQGIWPYSGALICISTTPSVEPSVEGKARWTTAMKAALQLRYSAVIRTTTLIALQCAYDMWKRKRH